MSNNEFNVKTHLLGFANYIKQNHLDMIFNEGKEEVEKFCIASIDKMNIRFNQLLEEGKHIDTAYELANQDLYNGLLFSKYKFVKDLLEKNHPIVFLNMEQSGSLPIQVIEILNQSAKVFEQFDTEDISLDLSALENKISPILFALIANKT